MLLPSRGTDWAKYVFLSAVWEENNFSAGNERIIFPCLTPRTPLRAGEGGEGTQPCQFKRRSAQQDKPQASFLLLGRMSLVTRKLICPSSPSYCYQPRAGKAREKWSSSWDTQSWVLVALKLRNLAMTALLCGRALCADGLQRFGICLACRIGKYSLEHWLFAAWQWLFPPCLPRVCSPVFNCIIFCFTEHEACPSATHSDLAPKALLLRKILSHTQAGPLPAIPTRTWFQGSLDKRSVPSRW